jgi:hypothetical protein
MEVLHGCASAAGRLTRVPAPPDAAAPEAIRNRRGPEFSDHASASGPAHRDRCTEPPPAVEEEKGTAGVRRRTDKERQLRRLEIDQRFGQTEDALFRTGWIAMTEPTERVAMLALIWLVSTVAYAAASDTVGQPKSIPE